MSDWHIWVVKLNKISRVMSFLDELEGVDEYVYPTSTKEYRLRNGSIRKRKVPLYSGYLFIKYKNSPEIYHEINSNPFVTTYVGRCSGADLDIVKQVREFEIMNSAARLYQIDDVVRVNCGPFKGFEGYVNGINSGTIIVSLKVFGRSVNVTLSKDDADIVKREI